MKSYKITENDAIYTYTAKGEQEALEKHLEDMGISSVVEAAEILSISVDEYLSEINIEY